MAACLNSVLRGVQPDLRDTILRLNGEGWSPSKTNGGHIRLMHPLAEKPVFTSTTPSDIRTPKNLIRDCKRTLLSSAVCAVASSPEMSGERAEEVLRTRKRHGPGLSRFGAVGMETAPQRVADQIVADHAKNESVQHVDQSPPEELDQIAPLETLNDTKPVHMEEKPEMNMMTSSDTDPARSMPIQSMPIQSTRAPTPPASPVPPFGVMLDQRAVEIGMRLALGELTRLVITAEMVGQTLLFEQAPFLIGTVPAPSEFSGHLKKPAYRKNNGIHETVMELINLYPGQEVTLIMIAEETVARGQYKNVDSARASLRKRLEALEAEGVAIYRRGPGEPSVRLKV